MRDPVSVVLVDIDQSRRSAVVRLLPEWISKYECGNFTELVTVLTGITPTIAVIGLMPSGPAEALEAVHHLRAVHPGTQVIVVADFSSEASAIAALRAHVADYLVGPVTALEISESIAKLLPPLEEDSDPPGELIGSSACMREVRNLIRRIAPMNSTVLITGETGAGKELAVRMLHRLSHRAKAPLICVNCSAIPDTLLESELFGHENGAYTGAVGRRIGQLMMADRGTLFLDEIGDMSLLAQSKILRVIEQREVRPLGGSKSVSVDIRLVAATHRHLENMIVEEAFRSDLFYRLNVARIHLPPLRQRIDDIPLLAAGFLRQLNSTNGRRVEEITPEAMRRLLEHHWPGNVRELRNVIEAAFVACDSDRISVDDLCALQHGLASPPAPMETRLPPVLPTVRVQPEPDLLMQALRATNWNMTKTAEILHWSRMTVYRKIAKYGIERPTASATHRSMHASADWVNA